MTTIKQLMRLFLSLTSVIMICIVLGIYKTNIFRKPQLFTSKKDVFPCHYTKLQPHNHGDDDVEQDSPLCRRRRADKSSCLKAIKYYGSPNEDLVAPKCTSPSKPNICWFNKTKNSKLFCDPVVCGSNVLYMGKRDTKLGDIRQWEAIKPFSTKRVLKFVDTALVEEETFCFIKCGSLMQVLIFPILHPKKKKKSSPNINVNIILIDSISRSHFYRTLRQSVKALRGILAEKSANVLDFEVLQSISTQTFENVRALFAGIDVKEGSSQSSSSASEIGLHVLYHYFKEYGYQTVFQEDLCWYDRWGTVLDNIKMKGSSKATKKRWRTFKKIISKHGIDNYGMTFFSCEVFKLYNDTNHFEYPAKVCLNGKFFSSYFLQYLEDLAESVKLSHNAPPYVSYTHFNTAHTATGIRIRNMDESLAHFIETVGRDPLTWTIILSDHGHKTTPYARWSVDGPYETTNPVLFMIIPDTLSKVVGKESMTSLVHNQHRLITTQDLYNTLTSFLAQNKTGLLVDIPSNRTCSDVPLMPLAKCQCQDTETRFKDNSPQHLWMAEFAVGQLNKEIERQFAKGSTSEAHRNCIPLITTSFTNIITSGSQTTFELHINASHVGLPKDEVFKVAIATNNKDSKLQSFERLTMYNKFKDCVDKSVDIKMCICDLRTSSKPLKHNRVKIKTQPNKQNLD